ncbi:MAG: potassium channel family protein [Gaiellaceae bacterium]
MSIRRSLAAELQSGESYAFVLALLLASLFLVIVAPEDTWARILRDAVVAATLVLAYWTATARRAFLVPRVIVPSIALVFVVVGAFEGATTQAAAAAIGAALTAWVAFLLARDLAERRSVDPQTVLGALSFYVLFGYFFASLFALVAEIGDGAFFTRGDDGSAGERLYFSFVTISTTGFGDLAPASGVGRAFVVLEIVVGQLYLVTVVAILVTAATRRFWTERSPG